MKIYNGTPHDIMIYARDDVYDDGRKFYVKEGAKPIKKIPSDGVLNAHIMYLFCGCNDGILFEIPEVKKVDPLPAGYDYYIVSSLYARAVELLGGDTSELLVVSRPVYDSPDNPRPVGCLGLAFWK